MIWRLFRKKKIDKFSAGVKVMNSYDYCHFEITLHSDQFLSLDEINLMRIKAQKLVDEAIRQYKKAKKMAQESLNNESDRLELCRKIERFVNKPKNEWDTEEKALAKALEDWEFARQFDYEEDEEGFRI